MLASPIILSDYQRWRPKAGATSSTPPRIDELLSLRIMTLTDEEKRPSRRY